MMKKTEEIMLDLQEKTIALKMLKLDGTIEHDDYVSAKHNARADAIDAIWQEVKSRIGVMPTAEIEREIKL